MGHICVSAALRFSQLLWVAKAINAMHCIYRSTSFFVLAILFLSHHTNTNTQHLFSLQALFYVQAPWDNLLPTGWMEGIWAVSFFTFSMTGEFVAFTVIGKNVFILLLCIAIWEERKMTGNATNFAIQIFVEKIVLWKTTKRSNILRNDRKYDKCCQLTFDFLNERTLSCELQLWPV